MKRLLALLGVLMVLVAACGSSDETGSATSTTAPAASSTTEAPAASATLPETTATAPTTTEASTTSAAAAGDVQACADVIGGEIGLSGDGTYRISATVRSGDTGWEKYADAWEVRTLGGDVIDVRVLAHPHETEQPFTRSLSGVVIPADVDQVELVAHDLVNGFCGETFTLDVPG